MKYNSWTAGIKKLIEDNGGECDLKTIYEEISNYVVMPPRHFKKTFGQPNFHHRVRSTLWHLRERDIVERVGTGVYKMKK